MSKFKFMLKKDQSKRDNPLEIKKEPISLLERDL